MRPAAGLVLLCIAVPRRKAWQRPPVSRPQAQLESEVRPLGASEPPPSHTSWRDPICFSPLGGREALRLPFPSRLQARTSPSPALNWDLNPTGPKAASWLPGKENRDRLVMSAGAGIAGRGPCAMSLSLSFLVCSDLLSSRWGEEAGKTQDRQPKLGERAALGSGQVTAPYLGPFCSSPQNY